MKYIYTAGNEAKAVDFANPIRDSWDFVEMMSAMPEAELYARVSAVNRAMNLTADATANIPFAVLKNGKEIDTSADWKNVVGLMPKPKELIRLWRLSLFMRNEAYGRVDKVNAAKSWIHYVVPTNIEIKDDAKMPLGIRLDRKANGTVVRSYSMNDKNLIRFWRLDHTTELLPSPNSEFKALANSAGILHAADWWTKNYFEKGAIRPTILAVKGMIASDKKEDLQAGWARFIRSLGTRLSELTKILNAETMDVKQIGDGLGDLKDSPVYRQSIENIAMASGIPLSVLLSNSANFATAQTEYAAWFRDSITPWAFWLEEVMNDQIFTPRGLHFEFRPEQSEPSQEEEVSRAGAYSQYVNAGMKPSIAAQIVGIDLPVDVEYEDLDGEPEPMPEPTPEPVIEIEEVEEEDDDEMTIKAWDELDTWRKKAIRYAKRGKAPTFDFKTEHIPADLADTIRKRLEYAGTPDEVRGAFEVKAVEDEPISEIQALADAINKAVEIVSTPNQSE
jgi:phage portal protein BeeE